MVTQNNDKPEKKKTQAPEVTRDILLQTLFLPENLYNIKQQHERYVKIKKAKGEKDVMDFVGTLNIIVSLGLRVNAMGLIDHENELGI